MHSIDLSDLIMRYETEGLDEKETRKLFQYLVDSGLAWTLQGSYGRMAQHLIDTGEITE